MSKIKMSLKPQDYYKKVAELKTTLITAGLGAAALTTGIALNSAAYAVDTYLPGLSLWGAGVAASTAGVALIAGTVLDKAGKHFFNKKQSAEELSK